MCADRHLRHTLVALVVDVQPTDVLDGHGVHVEEAPDLEAIAETALAEGFAGSFVGGGRAVDG